MADEERGDDCADDCEQLEKRESREEQNAPRREYPRCTVAVFIERVGE